MTLRATLQYQRPEPAKVSRLAKILAVIESSPKGPSVSSAIAEFNTLTGRRFTADDFASYYGAMSTETFLEQAAQPPPRRVPDMTRQELIEIVRLARAAGAEAEQSYYLELFDTQVPRPNASALLAYPPKGSDVPVSEWDPTNEQVVDLALAYKPIIL